jgi:hypothetical protein
MAPVVSELWRSVTPEDIDTALPDLWMEAARESPVSRALLSNLVVIRPGAHLSDQDSFHLGSDSDIVQVVEQHPARVILMNYVPVTGLPCPPSKAAIGVVTFGVGAIRYGVEMIAVDAVCAEASVPSIVRRLARGDVPTTLWWTADLSRVRPPTAMVETGRQFLYDSAGWEDVRAGADAASTMVMLANGPDVADLNWQRLAPIRRSIVHALKNEPRGTVGAPTSLVIRHQPAHRAAASLIGAWLQRGFRWNSLPAIEEADRGEEPLMVAMSGEGWKLTAAMNGERVLVESSAGPPPFSMPVPNQTVADGVIADLCQLGRDVYLRETLLTLSGRG